MKRTTCVILILVILQVQLRGQIQTARLDSLFDNLEKRELAFGNVIIMEGKDLRYSRSVGFARLDNEKKIPSHAETQYKIGSVSKMFTAVMVLQLEEEGKLTLDQTLDMFYPKIPNASTITIGHLLQHRSGLHDYTKDTDFENWRTQPRTHEQLIQLIIEKGPDFEPGVRAEYSNTNYLLLSYILEKVTEMDYDKVLFNRIISKLPNRYFRSGSAKEIQAISYKYTTGSWKAVAETHKGIHTGAGDIILNAGDLADFMYLLFNNKLIKQTSLEKMMTMQDGYGMGLFRYDNGTVKGYGHNGRIEEFYTATRYFPDRKLALVYCTNGINFPRIDILESIVKACFDEPVILPFSSAISASLSDYAGTYEAAQMPVVTISVQNKTLVAETQGAKFELEPVAENYFMHSITGYYFQFFPSERSLQIKETDNVYFLKKK